jgi:hypothetical protein
MKEMVSAFGSDVLRPLVSLVVPGTIAVVPGIAAWLWAEPTVRAIIQANLNIVAVAMVLLVLFAGLVCEDVGSHLEYLFDHFQDNPTGKRAETRRKGQHDQEWYEYLRIAYQLEPVGHHYMRTLVLRLKFELGSCIAFVFGLIGIWWLPTTYTIRAVASVPVLLLIALFFIESRWTHEVLSDLRTELLKGIHEWPTKLQANASQSGE